MELTEYSNSLNGLQLNNINLGGGGFVFFLIF